MSAIECIIREERSPVLQVLEAAYADIKCECGHTYTVEMVENGCWPSAVDFCPACDKATHL